MLDQIGSTLECGARLHGGVALVELLRQHHRSDRNSALFHSSIALERRSEQAPLSRHLAPPFAFDRKQINRPGGSCVGRHSRSPAVAPHIELLAPRTPRAQMSYRLDM